MKVNNVNMKVNIIMQKGMLAHNKVVIYTCNYSCNCDSKKYFSIKYNVIFTIYKRTAVIWLSRSQWLN